jgi:CRISPR-associated protein (TIGR02710 family)
MTRPVFADLPPDLQAIQKRWLALGREKGGRAQQEELYAREFAEPFARLFAALPLHGAPANLPRPRALISVLGLSWQPVALMAAWCKPTRMLVLGSEESLKLTPGGDGILSLVARVAGISRDVIELVRIGDPGEADIYRAVRDFLRQSGIPPREVFVDPTGGKKSMSASAALAGFLAGAPLVYVDYGEYHDRSPVAGTEYPRLLTNPLEVMGDLELRDVFGAFNRSDFLEAEKLAKRLAELLYEPREAECLAALARGYGAWDRFNFESARDTLRQAGEVLQRFSERGSWAWAPAVQAALARNLPILDVLAKVKKRPERIEDGMPLLAWYLAAARRLLDAQKPSLAVLLTYAAMERYVDLCLWTDFGLDDENPDYSQVAARLDRDKYDEAGRQLFGENYKARDLCGPLMLMNGAQLLCTLAPHRLAGSDLGPLKGLSTTRNKCEYEHGFLPQTPACEEAERHLQKAGEIVGRACSNLDLDLDRLLEDCRFPRLEAGR